MNYRTGNIMRLRTFFTVSAIAVISIYATDSVANGLQTDESGEQAQLGAATLQESAAANPVAVQEPMLAEQDSLFESPESLLAPDERLLPVEQPQQAADNPTAQYDMSQISVPEPATFGVLSIALALAGGLLVRNKRPEACK